MSDPDALEAAARKLLDALDRMHLNCGLSENVYRAYAVLRLLLPREVDPDDESRPREQEAA
jgi:hypothetical protein